MNAIVNQSRLRYPVGLLFVILLLQSCALTPQTVNLNPQVQSPTAPPIADGQAVSLVIIDMRPSGVVGNRGLSGTGYGGANVATAGDITEVVRTVVTDGLTASGFIVEQAKRRMPGNQLRVEITNLVYTVVPGIITGTLRSEASLYAECLHDKVSQYDHIHRGVSEEEVFFAQFAKENETHINKAFSSAISEMINDTDLLGCLIEL